MVFVRGDLAKPVRIPARVENRIETPRRTTLRAGGASVEMVEHILAALAGLQIDNCEVWVNAPEMPGCDGSSQPFVEALDSAGIVPQAAVRSLLVIHEITRLGNDESWIEARPATGGGLTAKYRLDYGRDNAIGRQTLALTVTPDSFRRELAPSRTFMLKTEADWLRSQGLGKRATDAGPADLRRATARSTTSCVSRTSACGTSCWTWWATWPWPAATWSATSSPTRAAIG